MGNLNDAVNQLDLIDIYRILHLTIVEYTIFSHVHDTVTKIDPILGHKTNVTKFKRIEIL